MKRKPSDENSRDSESDPYYLRHSQWRYLIFLGFTINSFANFYSLSQYGAGVANSCLLFAMPVCMPVCNGCLHTCLCACLPVRTHSIGNSLPTVLMRFCCYLPVPDITGQTFGFCPMDLSKMSERDCAQDDENKKFLGYTTEVNLYACLVCTLFPMLTWSQHNWMTLGTGMAFNLAASWVRYIGTKKVLPK